MVPLMLAVPDATPSAGRDRVALTPDVQCVAVVC